MIQVDLYQSMAHAVVRPLHDAIPKAGKRVNMVDLYILHCLLMEFAGVSGSNRCSLNLIH